MPELKIAARRFLAAGAVWARVEVADEGPGIPQDLLPHVFERYVSASRRGGGGLGLGFYLAKSIAALHGGDLTATSAPGQGARFTLTLPCGTKDEPAA